MRVNIVFTIVAIVLAGLFTLGIYNIVATSPRVWMYTIGSYISFVSSLIPLIGLSYTNARLGVNLRIFSLLSLIVSTIANVVMALYAVEQLVYLFIIGVIIVLSFALWYRMSQIQDI